MDRDHSCQAGALNISQKVIDENDFGRLSARAAQGYLEDARVGLHDAFLARQGQAVKVVGHLVGVPEGGTRVVGCVAEKAEVVASRAQAIHVGEQAEIQGIAREEVVLEGGQILPCQAQAVAHPPPMGFGRDATGLEAGRAIAVEDEALGFAGWQAEPLFPGCATSLALEAGADQDAAEVEDDGLERRVRVHGHSRSSRGSGHSPPCSSDM